MAYTSGRMSAPGSPAMAPLASKDSTWTISPQEKVKYDHIFDGLEPVNGMLSGDQIKPVLINSNLPVDVLGRVWDLSDIDKDGFLDRDEFCVAMHLVYRALEKDPVPMTLPPSLVPMSKRTMELKGVLPLLSGYTTAPSGRDSPPTSAPAAAAPVWVVQPSEMAKCEENFRLADTDHDGLVDGQQIRPILLHYGLPSQVLAHIWTLCDIQNTGQLNHEQFALALHLMHKKLQGIEPPKQLPAEMIPPSLRAPAGASLLDGLGALVPSEGGCKELDLISQDIDKLKRQKMQLEQEKSQKEADIKVRSSEVVALQKELDSINLTVQQLEAQKGEAQKRLDDLDDRRVKLKVQVTETREKAENHETQILEMQHKMKSQENMVRNQEEELKKLREQLTSLRQQEVGLESKVQASKTQLDQVGNKLSETEEQINLTRNKSQKLQDTQNSINQSINQYNALISGDKSAEEPSPIIMNNLRIDSDVSPVQNTVSSSSLGNMNNFNISGFNNNTDKTTFPGSNDVDPFSENDPFKDEDPFKDGDPFGSKGFKSAPSGDPFGGADPFGGDNQFDAFNNAGSGDGFGDFPDSASKKEDKHIGDPFGGDPFKKGLASARPTTASNDPFNPMGSGIASLTSPVNSNDPFGTDPFAPQSAKSPRRSKGHAPPPPSLPPKQKKAPPPRPPAPSKKDSSSPQSHTHPAPDPFEGEDPFGASSTNQPATLSTEPFGGSNFADFSPGKFQSEVEQLAWATQDSEHEWKRQQQIQEQEQSDLELAIALSKSTSK